MSVNQPVHIAVVVDCFPVGIRIHIAASGAHIDQVIAGVQIFYLTDELRRCHLGDLDGSLVGISQSHQFFYSGCRQCILSKIIAGLQIQHLKFRLYDHAVHIPVQNISGDGCLGNTLLQIFSLILGRFLT